MSDYKLDSSFRSFRFFGKRDEQMARDKFASSRLMLRVESGVVTEKKESTHEE